MLHSIKELATIIHINEFEMLLYIINKESLLKVDNFLFDTNSIILDKMATRKGMFAAFADDEDEGTTQTAPKQAPKKAPAQPKPAAEPKQERPQTAKPPRQTDNSGFDGVTGADSGRGGRGGRGGFRGSRGGDRRPRQEGGEGEGARGGRGGRGERRPRPEGAVEGGEDRRPRTEGGRGRGPRPPRVEGEGNGEEGGVVYRERKERVNHEGRTRGFAGKPRENWHPFDRKDGTGRGRGQHQGKAGHGKGNWGTVEDEVKQAAVEGETPVAQEGATEEKKAEEVVEEQKEEKTPAVEEKPVEEEEEPGKLTLAEYLAQKKKSTLKKEARGHDQVKRTGLEAAAEKTQKVVPIANTLKDQEVYNVAVGKSELSNLLQFQGQEDDFYSERTERRGGRGGFRGGRGGRGGRPAGDDNRKGGRQQQLRMDENAFPSLA